MSYLSSAFSAPFPFLPHHESARTTTLPLNAMYHVWLIKPLGWSAVLKFCIDATGAVDGSNDTPLQAGCQWDMMTKPDAEA
eukprot:6050404-Amphidinium_carterae.1